MAKKVQIVSTNENDTKNLARKIANLFSNSDMIILDGDLGAGKTHFVKGFAEGLHSHDLVTSPTFSIANFYETSCCTLLHIDLYRINTVEEFYDLGLTDYFDQSITIIEWGKKFSDCFDYYMLITFELTDNNGRLITIESEGERYKSMIDIIEKELIINDIC